MPTITQYQAHCALSRVTFGSTLALREAVTADEEAWPKWVRDQLAAGGDDAMDTRLRTICPKLNPDTRICPTGASGFELLESSVEDLAKPVPDSPVIHQLTAATFLRNAYSEFQIREVMVDFWSNHFNIFPVETEGNTSVQDRLLAHFDGKVIRPNALGNFRKLLHEVATSPSMLLYLNNADSTAEKPNENYARELMELHTLGAAAYNASSRIQTADTFCEEDVVQVSRALSGWTVMRRQKSANGSSFDDSYRFVYNERQHNTSATQVLTTKLGPSAGVVGIDQGKAVLDLLAYHKATASFVSGKICRQIFGEKPPQAVLDRALVAWQTNDHQPDQIAKVLEAILLREDGVLPEVLTELPTKVRRPYELNMAFVRACQIDILVHTGLRDTFLEFGDGPYAWPTPEGRPDTNAYWSNIAMQLDLWNRFDNGVDRNEYRRDLHTPSGLPTIPPGKKSPEQLVDYWSDRLLAQRLPTKVRAELVAYATWGAIPTRSNLDDLEYWLISFVAMIAMTPQFALR